MLVTKGTAKRLDWFLYCFVVSIALGMSLFYSYGILVDHTKHQTSLCVYTITCEEIR
jgi:hypothetical protein